jgi:hypothetical protein
VKAAARADKRRDQEKAAQRDHLVAERKRFHLAAHRKQLVASARGLRREPIVITQRANWQLSAPYRRRQWVRQFTALERIRSGIGTVHDAQVLAGAANIAIVLCEWGLGWEYDFVLLTGQRVVNSLGRFAPRDAVANTILGKRGVCPLDAAGLDAVDSMLEIHTAQLAHPDCTRMVMARADTEVFERAKRKRLARIPEALQSKTGPNGEQMVLTDTSDINKSMRATLRRVRDLIAPDDGGELDMALANLETFFAVATAVIAQTPAQEVRKCALLVANAAEKAAAEDGVPA